MGFHTDLAVELHESLAKKTDGIEVNKTSHDGIKTTEITVKTESAAAALGKPVGKYITIETDSIMRRDGHEEECIFAVKNALYGLVGNVESALVCGIGNREITADRVGPDSASMILSTRHISPHFAKSFGLGRLSSVSAISPGVLGQTGIEVSEYLKGIAKNINPQIIIAIDALSAREISRLGVTVQLSNSGITPGSGVHNARNEISEKTIGIPVISIGVPTVIDCRTLVEDCKGSMDSDLNMIVTPREIDTMVEHASNIVAMGINLFLQPHISLEDMMMLVG